MRAEEKLNVKAIYAAPFFNERSSCPDDGMERSYNEILKLLRLAGRERKVFKGSNGYLIDENTPIESDAVIDLVERAKKYSFEKPLYIVAIGAITNIASALIMEPSIADNVVVVWLGGNVPEWHDNKEFNYFQDVAAVRVVFNSGVPLVIVPCMGVASAFTTTEHELNYWLRGKNKLCDYLVEHTIEAGNKYAQGRIWSRPIWDVTAVGWLLNKDQNLMLDKLLPTPVPEYDLYYAQDPRRPLCRIVYHIQRDALLTDLVEHISK